MINNKINIQYASLSKDELYLISRAEFEKQKIITGEFAKKLFGDLKKVANIFDRLTRKGRLIQIERGKYIIVPIKAPNQLWSPNEFVAAKFWMGDIPYYIGYFTMYNYWGFTEQVPQTVFVLNTRKSCSKVIGNVKYKAVKIDKKKYYGIQKIKIDDEFICISDKERTLIDFIYNPICSFENIKKILKENLSSINLDKLIKYLIRFPVISVRKRAGYMLENINCPVFYLNKLKRTIKEQNSYTFLDPSKTSKKGKINNDWRIIVNK